MITAEVLVLSFTKESSKRSAVMVVPLGMLADAIVVALATFTVTGTFTVYGLFFLVHFILTTLLFLISPPTNSAVRKPEHLPP